MTLEQNPFHILGVSARDPRREILSAAQERSLVVDEQLVREARSALVHPIKRIAAEVAWLPGVTAVQVTELLRAAKFQPERVRGYAKLPALAHANLLAEALSYLGDGVSVDGVARWIVSIAETHDSIDIEATIELIDGDRSVAGLSLITRSDVVESALDDRRRYYRQAIQAVLERRSLSLYAQALTIAVEETTSSGQHAPLLIDDLVDRFEDQHRSVLEEGIDEIDVLCGEVLEAVSERREPVQVVALVRRLVDAVKAWDELVQPGQVSARGRGLPHSLSLGVARRIRRLAIRLHNDHGLLPIAIVLVNLQLEVFAEIDSVVEESEEDAQILAGMIDEHTDGGVAPVDDLVAALTGAVNPELSGQSPTENRQSDALSEGARGLRSREQEDGSPGCGCLLILVAFVVAVVFALCGSGADRGARSVGSASSSSDAQQVKRTGSQSTPPAERSSSEDVVRDDVSLVYRRPSVGDDRLLSVSHIRWCFRQSIRIETIRDVVKSRSHVGRFNELVADYNARCGSYRYRTSSLSRARRDVESVRGQIEAEAISEFSAWE